MPKSLCLTPQPLKLTRIKFVGGAQGSLGGAQHSRPLKLTRTKIL